MNHPRFVMQLIAETLPNAASEGTRGSLKFFYYETKEGTGCVFEISMRKKKSLLFKLEQAGDYPYTLVIYKDGFGQRYEDALATLSVECQKSEPRDEVILYGSPVKLEDMVHAFWQKHKIELSVE